MKRMAAIVATAIGLAYAFSALAQSDMPPLVHNPRITVDYQEPHHPIYGLFLDPDDARVANVFGQLVKTYERLSGIKQRLVKRQLLEEFSQFLAPVKLPVALRLVAKQCDTINAFYDPAKSRVVLCYEWVQHAEDTAPKAPTPQGITREDAIIGGVVGVLLHEAGHALSNLLRLPVLSREEDTADQIAGFLSLQFGRDVARTLIKGEAYSWHVRAAGQARYWGVHSSSLQRQHNYLCLGYGKDPEAFEDFVTKFGWLPKERAANCANEYRQVEHAFRTTILPHLDMELMKKVQERKWLRPDDGKR
jgi:hypothetical protein